MPFKLNGSPGLIGAGIFRLEVGDTGVLAAGRWLTLRAAVWLGFHFTFAALAFFASLELGDWLHLTTGTAYPIAILVPAVALAIYAVAVRIGERRNIGELGLLRAPRDLIVGGLIGCFITLSLFLSGCLAFLISRGDIGSICSTILFSARTYPL